MKSVCYIQEHAIFYVISEFHCTSSWPSPLLGLLHSKSFLYSCTIHYCSIDAFHMSMGSYILLFLLIPSPPILPPCHFPLPHCSPPELLVQVYKMCQCARANGGYIWCFCSRLLRGFAAGEHSPFGRNLSSWMLVRILGFFFCRL